MKIVFRLSALGFGGTERVFLSVADYLSTVHGWTITFVVDQIRENETESVALSKGFAVVGLGAGRTWRSIWPFFRYLRDAQPDIFISAYTETNGAALLSNALLGLRIPVIVTEHAALDEHWAKKRLSKRLCLELTVRQLYRLADHVLCVSKGVADGVKRRINSRPVSHIFNPVRFSGTRLTREEARSRLNLTSSTPMLLAVGRISRQKNYSMLVNAVASIQCELAQVYIVGGVYEREVKDDLDRLVGANNLGARVNFIDFTHDIGLYYAAADALVLSSAWEGFGNVLVEALAFGLPIVSTRCNHGPAEILENGLYGELVSVDDVTAMAKAIDKVLTRSGFQRQLQIERSQEFSEARIGQQYYELITRKLRPAQ